MSKNKRILSPEEVISKRKKNILNFLLFADLIKKLLFLLIFIYLIFNFVFGIVIMPNRDMSPKVEPSDLLIYYRLDEKYVADEVVVVRKDNKDYVLRIVAVGGDKVNINDKGLNINGANQSSSNIYYKTGIYEDGIKFPIEVKEDEVFVLGDLREGAKDSRYFGAIKKSDIKGKIFILLRRREF